MYLILLLPIIHENSIVFTIHITLRPFQGESTLQHKIDRSVKLCYIKNSNQILYNVFKRTS